MPVTYCNPREPECNIEDWWNDLYYSEEAGQLTIVGTVLGILSIVASMALLMRLALSFHNKWNRYMTFLVLTQISSASGYALLVVISMTEFKHTAPYWLCFLSIIALLATFSALGSIIVGLRILAIFKVINFAESGSVVSQMTDEKHLKNRAIAISGLFLLLSALTIYNIIAIGLVLFHKVDLLNIIALSLLSAFTGVGALVNLTGSVFTLKMISSLKRKRYFYFNVCLP